MSYQGWKNWDTWNAHLWLTNDYDTYRYILQALSGFDVTDARQNILAADVLQGTLRNCLPCGDARRDGQAWDGIDFDAVDWCAVALAFADDLVTT